MSNPRHEALLSYLRLVARELIVRGVLRGKQGQDVVDILKEEPAEMMGSIIRDLKTVGFSLGDEIVGGMFRGMFGALSDFVMGKHGQR